MEVAKETVTPYTPGEDEMLHALGHVYYEIQQFYWCIVLQSQMPKETFRAIQNAYFESMLVHVRVLKDFFEQPSRRVDRKTQQEMDDVLSSDFGFKKAAMIVELPQETQRRINKELVHLTYSRQKRVTFDEKKWDFDPILPLVMRCIEFMQSRTDEELQRMDVYRVQKGMDPLAPAWANLLNQLLIPLSVAMQKSLTATTT